mgnify:CR=1 FL=1
MKVQPSTKVASHDRISSCCRESAWTARYGLVGWISARGAAAQLLKQIRT